MPGSYGGRAYLQRRGLQPMYRNGVRGSMRVRLIGFQRRGWLLGRLLFPRIGDDVGMMRCHAALHRRLGEVARPWAAREKGFDGERDVEQQEQNTRPDEAR